MDNDIPHRYVHLYSDFYIRHPLSPAEGEVCLSWQTWERKHLPNQSKEICVAPVPQSREGRALLQKTLTAVSFPPVVQNLHGHGRIVLIETQVRLSIWGLIGSS